MVVLLSLWRDVLLPSCGTRSGRSGHARGHAKQQQLLELELLRDLLLRLRENRLRLGLARCLGWARGGEHDRDEIRLRLARHLVLLLLFLRTTHQQVMRRRA